MKSRGNCLVTWDLVYAVVRSRSYLLGYCTGILNASSMCTTASMEVRLDMGLL